MHALTWHKRKVYMNNDFMDEFGDSHELAWLLSWLNSPIGEGNPISVGKPYGEESEDGSILTLEINAERGVSLLYDDDELVLKIIHPENGA